MVWDTQKLLVGFSTVPSWCFLRDSKVLSWCFLRDGTVPSRCFLRDGTVPSYNHHSGYGMQNDHYQLMNNKFFFGFEKDAMQPKKNLNEKKDQIVNISG